MQVSHSLLPDYSTFTVRFIRWNVMWKEMFSCFFDRGSRSTNHRAVALHSGMQTWQSRYMGAKELGRKSKSSTWIWAWSWNGFDWVLQHSSTLLTQQYSEVTSLPPQTPSPSPGAVMKKHFHSHLRMKSLRLSRRQRLKVWFLLYSGTNGSLELFGTTHNLWVYVVVLFFYV